MLKGEKVGFRPLKRSDIEYFLRWYNDMEVTQYVDGFLPSMEMTEEKGIEELATKIRAGTDVFFIIEALDDDNKTIGHIQLVQINPKDHKAGFGIFIGEKSHWSKGYGTEATQLILNYGFRQLNLHRIESGALAFNERSIRMQKAVGFQEEGRHRQAVFINGEYHDHIIFGLLREEWKKL